MGEFGWELCSWNPILRKKAKEYDTVIVEGPANSEYLYEFADEYRINEPVPGHSDEYKGMGKSFTPESGAFVLKPVQHLVCPQEKRSFRKDFEPDLNKEWRCLATEPKAVADVLFAFRAPKIYRGRTLTDKEYPVEFCTELVRITQAAGLSVACIGGKDNYHITDTVDLRGTPLKEQCAALSGSKVCVGPSSAPLHLASLCKVPHVTWYNRLDKTNSIPRYRNFWNPFETSFTYMKQQLPSPEDVLLSLKDYV